MNPAVRQLLLASGSRYVRNISPNSGNDGNPGTASAPWRTGTNISTNASVGFKRGETNTGAITVSAASARIGSYGGNSGLKGVFDTRAVLSGWIPQGVFANVYQATASLTADVKNLGNVFLNGVMMPQVSSLALLDAGVVGSCFVSDWTLAAPIVYVKSATNPASDGVVYTIPTAVALTVSGANSVLEDIEANCGIHQDGSIRVVARGVTARRSNFANGARHCYYTFPGAVLEYNTFGPARNDLEGSANTLIVNDTTTTGEGYTSIGCTYTGTGGSLVTGPDMHDSTPAHLMGTVTHTNDRFVDLVGWITANGAYTVTSPRFDNVTGGASLSVAGYVFTITGGSGTLDQLYNNTGSGTINSTGGIYTIRTLPTGFYRTNSASADTTLNITNETLTVQTGPSTNSQVIRHVRGAVAVNGLSIVTNPSGLCAPINDIIVAGISATASFTGNNNTYPFGSRFTLNGTAYNTLALWQAFTGQEASSTLVTPVAVGSDSFTRADENLEATTWVRIGGAAAQAAVRSNQLACIGTTQTLYKFADATSGDQWVRFVTASAPVTAGPFVVIRAVDANNWIGIRANSTTYQVFTCVAGSVVSLTSTTGIVPAPGDVVHFSGKGGLGWVYINGITYIQGVTLTGAASLQSNTGVGVVSRSQIINPFIDDFSYGTV